MAFKKGTKFTKEHIDNLVARKKEYYQTHDYHMKLSHDIVEKQRQARLRYYKTHGANNKGIPHSPETIAKIRQSCIKSGVGKWNQWRKHPNRRKSVDSNSSMRKSNNSK